MSAHPEFDNKGEPSPRTVLPSPGSSARDCAIQYAGILGLEVFPAPYGEKKSYKSAQYSGGAKWGATTDTTVIYRDFSKRWTKTGEECQPTNIGIVTGETSGIFVVETDTALGHGVDGAESLAALEIKHRPLPQTLEAESPSGSIHRYYKHPGFHVGNSESVIASGVDVRGDGGMVIAPPSVMPDRPATADKPAKPGGIYKWRNDFAIANAPQWLLDLITTSKKTVDPDGTPPGIGQQAADGVRKRRGAILGAFPKSDGAKFWRAVNDSALNAPSYWVPKLFSNQATLETREAGLARHIENSRAQSRGRYINPPRRYLGFWNWRAADADRPG